MTEVLLVLVLAITPTLWPDQGQAAPAPVVQPMPAQDPPAPAKMAPVANAVAPPLTPAETQDLRDNISNMEGLLATGVLNGARRFQEANPGMVLVASGQPRARGFVLEGYGLFFDVEIPPLDGSVELTLAQFQREMAKRLDDQVAPSPGKLRPASSQDVPFVDDSDPNAPYRAAVILACTSAMLDYSRNLNVQPNEWLTVALRGSERSLGQGIRDSQTWILRIKGNDLADYLASRISKEDAIRKVEKRAF